MVQLDDLTSGTQQGGKVRVNFNFRDEQNLPVLINGSFCHLKYNTNFLVQFFDIPGDGTDVYDLALSWFITDAVFLGEL